MRSSDVILLADNILPEWRTKDRKSESVFARCILANTLLNFGEKKISVAKVFGLSHASICALLKKDISPKYLSCKEKDIVAKWNYGLSDLERADLDLEERIKHLETELLNLKNVQKYGR